MRSWSFLEPAVVGLGPFLPLLSFTYLSFLSSPLYRLLLFEAPLPFLINHSLPPAQRDLRTREQTLARLLGELCFEGNVVWLEAPSLSLTPFSIISQFFSLSRPLLSFSL
ncbi:hypothetical protein AMTRI_Chr09g39250 [Amborella trichopoda]